MAGMGYFKDGQPVNGFQGSHDGAVAAVGYVHDTIPKQGFYVDKSGILYLDGDQVCGDDEKKFDARSKKRNEDCRKHPGGPHSLADPALVAQFMPAALSLAKAWDETYQEGRMSLRAAKIIKDNPRLIPDPIPDPPPVGRTTTFNSEPMYEVQQPVPGHVLVWDGDQMKWDAQPVGDEVYPDGATVGLDEDYIEEIVDRVTQHQETQINLLSAQVDSLQTQINVANTVKIEEAFADEKFDSFKNRAKETLKEAYAVIEDMEGLDRLHEAKAIKEAALAENRRQLVLTSAKVRERLERLQKANRASEESRQSGGIPVGKIIFVIALLALAAYFGPAILALIF